MRLKLSLAAMLIAGAAFAQPAPPPDDADDEGSNEPLPMQCVIDPMPDGGAISCDAQSGPPGSPCNCPEAGPVQGHRERADD
jgi:hypothetical protein